MRRSPVLALGVVAGALWLAIWAWDGRMVPALGGPSVECGGVSPARCEDAWRALAEEWGIHNPTHVIVRGTDSCISFIEIRYGVFPWNAVVAQSLC